MLNALQINWTHVIRLLSKKWTAFSFNLLLFQRIVRKKILGVLGGPFFISNSHYNSFYYRLQLPAKNISQKEIFVPVYCVLLIHFHKLWKFYLYKMFQQHMEKSNYRNQCINKYPIPIMKPMQLSVGVQCSLCGRDVDTLINQIL